VTSFDNFVWREYDGKNFSSVKFETLSFPDVVFPLGEEAKNFNGDSYIRVLSAIGVVSILSLVPAGAFSADGDFVNRQSGSGLGNQSQNSSSAAGATQNHSANPPFIGADYEFERAVYNAVIQHGGIPGGECRCPAGGTRIGFNNSRPIYDAKEIGVGDGAWCMLGGAYEGATAEAVPCLPPAAAKPDDESKSVLPPLTFKLELSLDAEFKSQGACMDRVGRAIKLSDLLIPAGSAKATTESTGYCKTLFPEANSPALKITMASFLTVHTFEECVVKVSTAKKVADKVSQWIFNHLEEVEDVKEYCLYRYKTAGGKVSAAALKAIEAIDPVDLMLSLCEEPGSFCSAGQSGSNVEIRREEPNNTGALHREEEPNNTGAAGIGNHL
jgi:hypothetical protein